MFVDASAICAALLKEEDGDDLYERMRNARQAVTSPMAVWESTVAAARSLDAEPADAREAVMRVLRSAGVELLAVPPEAAELAVEAFERFGKGRHPAGLNFGDCFAYACARHFQMPLLYKGEDFAQTDIKAA